MMKGGCACGAVRYEIDAAPIVSLQCQCRDCQRASGGGHANALAFPDASVRLTGNIKYYEVRGDRGHVVRRGFCPNCGSPITLTTSGNAALRVITAGSLDDPGAFKPQMAFYTRSGHAWDQIDPALTKFETLPPKT
jgi:hypothetical protein